MNTRLELRLEPRWEELPRLRRTTNEFLGARGLTRDEVDAVTMVTCELTENATKYGSFAGAGARIDVSLTLQQGEVTVEVSQPVDSDDTLNLTRLDRMVQWIRGFQDPFEAYLQRLKELSTEDPESNESRLGLVRIAYEGQSVLDFFVNEQNVLAVSAIRRLA
jgi:hypothetical protein